MVRGVDISPSVDAVRAGGLPLRARARLLAHGAGRGKPFTSDLSVSEHYLVRQAGCEPIAQVMGSSIYHVGQIPDYKGTTGELTSLSDAHREARRLALGRITEEAMLLDADAVVGAHLNERMITMGARGKGGDDGGEVLEFTVVGTAVRAPWIDHPPGRPVVTDLSGQDIWALRVDGFEPCGFLFEFCRYHVFHVTNGKSFNCELEAASKAVDAARRIAADKITAQAARQGAEFVIGGDVTVCVRDVPCGHEGCRLDDLDVDVTWFGTGVRRISGARAARLPPPSAILSMLPLGRSKRALIDAEDDSEEILEAAEDAEEAALELEEYTE